MICFFDFILKMRCLGIREIYFIKKKILDELNIICKI